jgi:hypothetical protein
MVLEHGSEHASQWAAIGIHPVTAALPTRAELWPKRRLCDRR